MQTVLDTKQKFKVRLAALQDYMKDQTVLEYRQEIKDLLLGAYQETRSKMKRKSERYVQRLDQILELAYQVNLQNLSDCQWAFHMAVDQLAIRSGQRLLLSCINFDQALTLYTSIVTGQPNYVQIRDDIVQEALNVMLEVDVVDYNKKLWMVVVQNYDGSYPLQFFAEKASSLVCKSSIPLIMLDMQAREFWTRLCIEAFDADDQEQVQYVFVLVADILINDVYYEDFIYQVLQSCINMNTKQVNWKLQCCRHLISILKSNQLQRASSVTPLLRLLKLLLDQKHETGMVHNEVIGLVSELFFYTIMHNNLNIQVVCSQDIWQELVNNRQFVTEYFIACRQSTIDMSRLYCHLNLDTLQLDAITNSSDHSPRTYSMKSKQSIKNLQREIHIVKAMKSQDFEVEWLSFMGEDVLQEALDKLQLALKCTNQDLSGEQAFKQFEQQTGSLFKFQNEHISQIIHQLTQMLFSLRDIQEWNAQLPIPAFQFVQQLLELDVTDQTVKTLALVVHYAGLRGTVMPRLPDATMKIILDIIREYVAAHRDCLSVIAQCLTSQLVQVRVLLSAMVYVMDNILELGSESYEHITNILQYAGVYSLQTDYEVPVKQLMIAFIEVQHKEKLFCRLCCIMTYVAYHVLTTDIPFVERCLQLLLDSLYSESLDIIHTVIDCLNLFAFANSLNLVIQKGVIEKVVGAITEHLYHKTEDKSSPAFKSQLSCVIAVRLFYSLLNWLSYVDVKLYDDQKVVGNILDAIEDGLRSTDQIQGSVDSITSRGIQLAAQHVLWQMLYYSSSRQPKREHIKLALIQVKYGQESEQDILSNQISTESFIQFERILGNEVYLDDHSFYLAGLDRDQSSIFYQDKLIELMYHVPSRMKFDPLDTKFTKKKRHIGNDHVHIVWNEHCRPYKQGTIGGDFGNTVIVVSPGLNDLYNIHIIRDHQLPFFGPLQDGCQVRKDLAGYLIRQTAINAYRANVIINFHQQTQGTTHGHQTAPMLYKYPYEDREQDLKSFQSSSPQIRKLLELL